MQSGLSETPTCDSQTANTQLSQQKTPQHGSDCSRSGLPDGHPPLPSRSPSSDAECSGGSAAEDLGRPERGRLDRPFDRLNVAESNAVAPARAAVAGQRISEYENAAVLLSSSPRRPSSRQPLGFKVTSRSRSDGVQLTDFPNEILTQILSHLHPDSHGAVALVSKRLYALVTTPYAWRAAFLRYFAGQDALPGHAKADPREATHVESSDVIRSEVRYFTRLTPLASWRSEYLLRTRLLRSVVRGKPGSIGSSSRSSQSVKKASAVLTYNSKLPWMISHVHADFTGGRKGPRVIHGTRDLGVATASDPTTGKIEKWGLDDPFSFQQLDEVYPSLEFYGVGDGPAAVPNVMDVSQPYGLVGGEGFPGGRVYYKAAGQLRGHYLGYDLGLSDAPPDFPKVPALVDAVSCVWIAKSSAVTSATQSMVGILAGSTLGVVTSYALGHESTGPRYADGDMTARWVLCPGVPIIDIKVDDQYSLRRRSLGRVWAVALNALGEVYYLSDPPTPPPAKGKAEDAVRDAWNAGRTAYWELIEPTRRIPSPDEFDKNPVSGAYSPRSSANAMGLSRDQLVAEAREIEQFFRLSPSHFRKACQGWDMLRRLEVDFAAGGGTVGGEAVFVITCGSEEGESPSIRRFVKGGGLTDKSSTSGALTPVAPPLTSRGSIFGGGERAQIVDAALHTEDSGTEHSPVASGLSTPRLGLTPGRLDAEEWRCSTFNFKHSAGAEITASAVDMSLFAVAAAFEDPLIVGPPATGTNSPATPTSKHATGEIPGRRARLLAIGTSTGSVVLWNMRDTASSVVNPLRVIQTESPEITSLAVSALYVVHGGSDSLVQAWDPLASTLEPIRTLNARSSGRIPRHILNTNPALQHANYFAVRSIFLDPDPAVLRGVLAFGTFVRFWTYSSTNQAPGRKRRLRHSDIHGRLASRRHSGTVSSYIAAEEAELRHEQEHRSREIDRLRKRFGVGPGQLTEEEALQYAQMISEESFLLDEQRRLSSSDTAGETASSTCSTAADTVTPEPSLSGLINGNHGGGSVTGSGAAGPSRFAAGGGEDGEDDANFEAQIQRAIRLSLMEGVNEGAADVEAQSRPFGDAPGGARELFQVKVKTPKGKGKGRGKGQSASASPQHEAEPSAVGIEAVGGGATATAAASTDIVSHVSGFEADEDLAVALRLSLEEEAARQRRIREKEEREREAAVRLGGDEEFPPLEGKGKGKAKSPPI